MIIKQIKNLNSLLFIEYFPDFSFFEYISGFNNDFIGREEFIKIYKNVFKDSDIQIKLYDEHRIKYLEKITKITYFDKEFFFKCLINAYEQAEDEIVNFDLNYSGLLLKILLNIEMDIYFLLKYLSSYQNSIFYGGVFNTLTYKYFFINYFNV